MDSEYTSGFGCERLVVDGREFYNALIQGCLAVKPSGDICCPVMRAGLPQEYQNKSDLI
jgi:hypothetical protein